MTPLQMISERVRRNGDPDDATTPRPLLTILEFFEGNNVVGSIGCNLVPPPEPREFFEALTSIRYRGSEVADVRIQISSFDAPEWPFSDTVYVMTTAAPQVVQSWFPRAIRPDRVSIEKLDFSHEPCVVRDGFDVVACWWD